MVVANLGKKGRTWKDLIKPSEFTTNEVLAQNEAKPDSSVFLLDMKIQVYFIYQPHPSTFSLTTPRPHTPASA